MPKWTSRGRAQPSGLPGLHAKRLVSRVFHATRARAKVLQELVDFQTRRGAMMGSTNPDAKQDNSTVETGRPESNASPGIDT
jgi:hypothetical protein